MIATDQAWSQNYGYFEIRAQIPVGEGRWPSFWLAPAGTGWPPEIDIFEAYGKALNGAPTRDGRYVTSVFFDRIDASGAPTLSVDIVNPYAPEADGSPQIPDQRGKAGGEQYVFDRVNDAADFAADTYSEFWTYAAEWTPNEIVFYFGRDQASLVEVYRAPTPDDLHSKMYLIANDQVGSRFEWNPDPAVADQTFHPDNTFKIDYIDLRALRPTETLRGAGPGSLLVAGENAANLLGGAGDDVFVGGKGQDNLDLGQGADTIYLTRGLSNTIVSGFGSDDRLVLEGFAFDGVGGALDHLRQVGNDVWLINGAYPDNPQTVLFRDIQIAHFGEENLAVRWSETPDIWSNLQLDQLRKNNAANTFFVQADPDGSRLGDGGSDAPGTVTLKGSAAGDIYYVYRPDTVVQEETHGGVDTLNAYRPLTLPANIENLVVAHGRSGALYQGNELGNRIKGSASPETLAGAGGDDLIDLRDGGADILLHRTGDGHDTVLGFGPDDVLVVEGLGFANTAALMARIKENRSGRKSGPPGV
jgi:hypothetical protein